LIPYWRILGVNIAHEHRHRLCAVNILPTFTGMPELAISVAERYRMP
jgi:hypothetical protein